MYPPVTIVSGPLTYQATSGAASGAAGFAAPYVESGLAPHQVAPAAAYEVNVLSGGLGSGSISSGSVSALHLASGAILSGTFAPQQEPSCPRCGRTIPRFVAGDQVTVTGVSGLIERWCWTCAGYRYQSGGFETREDWIRETVPIPDAPAGVIADWLRDQSRDKDADYMLDVAGRTSGG